MPLLDRVLVQRVKAETKTASGIFLPESSVEKLNEAKVLAVGPGLLDKKGNRLPMGVAKGDRVLIPQVGFPCLAPLLIAVFRGCAWMAWGCWVYWTVLLTCSSSVVLLSRSVRTSTTSSATASMSHHLTLPLGLQKNTSNKNA